MSFENYGVEEVANFRVDLSRGQESEALTKMIMEKNYPGLKVFVDPATQSLGYDQTWHFKEHVLGGECRERYCEGYFDMRVDLDAVGKWGMTKRVEIKTEFAKLHGMSGARWPGGGPFIEIVSKWSRQRKEIDALGWPYTSEADIYLDIHRDTPQQATEGAGTITDMHFYAFEMDEVRNGLPPEDELRRICNEWERDLEPGSDGRYGPPPDFDVPFHGTTQNAYAIPNSSYYTLGFRVPMDTMLEHVSQGNIPWQRGGRCIDPDVVDFRQPFMHIRKFDDSSKK